ncbi:MULTISPECIES: shikimate kinase [Sulfurovum]|uniref:Shikimate kinase n=1 Tax=Sulfurovum xiamenensis TaxID=3019066 RepID=A0ABT7QRY0_9BACT|nr:MULTISPECIES: shikimate kinase [Sulfurovum]EIF50035.1 shikimate kinase [Sulfurovum sp. AR]MDM5263765.1 shikimate kinase [Sulfurovum xiamenensis]
MKKNIILIGFMGVGKGTTARAFTKKYGTYIIDTDDLIESKENKEVKKIFEKKGEAYFRAQEQVTADWIEKCVTGTLISCGGGFYKVNNLKKLGTVVLLDASFDWIHNRLKTAKNAKSKLAKRPLFSDEKKAKKLYNEREKAYRKVADVIIDVEKLTLEEQIAQIAKKCKV